MRSGTESTRAQPALTLNHDELLLLEALLCFHTRVSTSPQLRARLSDLWDRMSRVRIAASAAHRVQAPDGRRSHGAGPGRS
jgi:hypothetical protein